MATRAIVGQPPVEVYFGENTVLARKAADDAAAEVVRAQAWAEGTEPGGPGTYSAKEGAELSEAWATGTEPGGPGTKSAQQIVDEIDAGTMLRQAESPEAGLLITNGGEAFAVVSDPEAGGAIYRNTPSSNLYNTAAKVTGYYIQSSTGALSPNVSAAVSADIPCSPGDQFTISTNGNRQAEVAFYTGPNATGPILPVNTTLDPKTVTAPATAAFMKLTVAFPGKPEPSQIMVNAGAVALPYEPFGSTAELVSVWPPSSAGATLHLAGSGISYVESARSGTLIRNGFVAFPVPNLTAAPCRVNLRDNRIGGVQLRDGSDDSAPDKILGTDLGGNHGYRISECTANGHGKVTADEGSVWAQSGVESVLVKVLDANKLLMARRTTNAFMTTGTWTHVSGATNTGNIVITAQLGKSWFPPHKNYSIRVMVDGVTIEDQTGDWPYSRDVKIVESCDFISRPDYIAWWVANGGASGAPVNAAASYTQTLTHYFDRDGQLTIYCDWLVLKSTAMEYLRGFQVGLLGSPLSIVVPGAVPFTYQGNSIDYSRGAAANLTVAGNEAIKFDAAKLQATGEYGSRALTLWSDAIFATGFLPIGDVAPGVRRTRVANLALEIETSGKIYGRVLDIGARTAAAGERYSMAAYRHIIPRSSARLSLYTVRTPDGGAYVYADWIDKPGLDRLPLPDDLIGRNFTVVEARGVTLSAGIVAGSLPVVVANGVAALILRVD
ncbi:hypothetical protein [Sphingopyxis macrogoltabida]|uniref:Uncharacterized protein n=1 Tax=Sphingopyxis macrogoltabida TaxID=33050 RepID=A0AAC8Z1U4_SPHMC|nr:hypothetical protein [Sphingopyxis macrogoltabida]ALJ14137.1 hypothetical protein LH19_14785 [Sphingopyxis macrogoltabida]AMU90403.1 hypothetical protein ATM17_15360 [Sphingopyxis macrogoltabida]